MLHYPPRREIAHAMTASQHRDETRPRYLTGALGHPMVTTQSYFAAGDGYPSGGPFWSHWSGPGYAGSRPPRSPGVGLRPAGCVRCLDRLVPGGRRVGRRHPGGAGARSGRPDRGPHHGPVARTRSAVPPRMVRPDRRVLRHRRTSLAYGAGHFSPLEAPGAFAATILAAVQT